MAWLNNLSIKYKLLLGFILIALLGIPVGVYSIYSTRHMEKSFNNIVNHAFPRILALVEIKNTATKIEMLTVTCEASESNTIVENRNQACKNELLANIEKITDWAKQYQQNLPTDSDSSLDRKKLTALQDNIIFSALNMINAKVNNNAKLLLTSRKSLTEAELALEKYIESAIQTETANLEKAQKSVSNDVASIFDISLLSTVLVAIIAILVGFILANIIAKPIIRLSNFSKNISKDNTENKFLVHSSDEVGQLAASINEMLKNLAETHQQLMTIARQAGMAEVATSVLHNVGNVLNSINVSASLLLESITNSKLKNFNKAAELLEKNTNNLIDYLTNDEQGKHLPGYIIKLAKHVDQEQITVTKEIDLLLKHIQHIKDIIARQQSLSGRVEVIAPISLTEMIDESILLTGITFSKYNIKIERHYQKIPPVLSDKVKFQQIMINLIRNAKDALVDCDNENKKITISLAQQQAENIYIKVADNGIGVEADNCNRIFNFGFTTKKDGHGFGLHSAVLAAKELGCSLTVESKGLNQGTTFILKLPIILKKQEE